MLDVEMPIYRMGECLLHAEKLATNLGVEDGEVLFQTTYSGLNGRVLDSIDGRRRMYHDRYSRQDYFTNTIQVEIARLRDNLPEVLLELLSPLYVMFEFFKPTPQLVNSVVDGMKR